MSKSASEKVILITGASGYLALNIINQLAKEPHKIRATVRNLNDKSKIEMIQNAAKGSKYPIEIVYADLLKPETWDSVCKGVNVLMHVASPYPSQTPKDVENDLIKPALEGTKNVLNAALKANISRVVLTSSTISIYDFSASNKTFNENDWANADKSIPYGKSKILAEKAAWDLVNDRKKKGEKCFELAVINPSIMLGPSLGDSSSLGTSELTIAGFLQGEPKESKEFYCGHCDVRDVALAHIRAAFLPQAAGHRHLIVSEKNWMSYKRTFDILKEHYQGKGYKLNTKFEQTPNPNNSSDNSRMVDVLGVKPTDYKKTVIDMAESLIKIGCVKI